MINSTDHYHWTAVRGFLPAVLKLFHLLHDVHHLRTLHIDQSKCGDVDAIVLEVFEIERLDVLVCVGEKFVSGIGYVRISANLRKCWTCSDSGSRSSVAGVSVCGRPGEKRRLKFRRNALIKFHQPPGRIFTVRKNLFMCCGFVSIINL